MSNMHYKVSVNAVSSRFSNHISLEVPPASAGLNQITQTTSFLPTIRLYASLNNETQTSHFLHLCIDSK